MKTLPYQTLLYDEDCPLCNVYTSGFIATSMLDKDGRKPYAQITAEERLFIDSRRACNEIALVDNKSKTVLYGIDSLLKIIGNSFPIIEKIGNIKPVNLLLKKLYSVISYNRKVIIPGKANTDRTQCLPDFNYRYRLSYVVFVLFITAIVLYKFATLIPHYTEANFLKEIILASGQLLFQSLFILGKDKITRITYLGNLMTVSLFGSLLLIPLLIVSNYWTILETLVLMLFGLVVLAMFVEHYRRVRLLELPKYLCLTWVLYRMIALPFYI